MKALNGEKVGTMVRSWPPGSSGIFKPSKDDSL